MTSPDLVVVGAGPAGMAATARALAGGLTVALVDSAPEVGGQFWRHPRRGTAPSGVGADLHHDLGTYRRLRTALDAGVAAGRLALHLGREAWTVDRAGDSWRVHLVPTPAAPRVLVAPHLLVATGAHDVSLPFDGWDLPGVMTAGGLQALLKGSGVRAGQRVVVGGSGPFLLPVAAGLAARGARVVVAEAGGAMPWLRQAHRLALQPAKVLEGASYAAALARARVPVLTRTAVVAAHGADRVTSVELARLDADGRPIGPTRRVEVDAVGVTWGFSPRLDLLLPLGPRRRRGADGREVPVVDAWQATSVRGLWTAGETTGVGGAALAVAEGELAGWGVLHALGRATAPAEVEQVRRRVAGGRRFADALALASRLPHGWMAHQGDPTTLCRCEEVTVGTVRRAIGRGLTTPAALKHETRAGMGWCQGRVCSDAVAQLCGQAPSAGERLVAASPTLGGLADGLSAM